MVSAFFIIKNKMIKNNFLISIMTVISLMFCSYTFASCGGDDEETEPQTTKTILGSYSGMVTVNVTSKSDGSAITNYSTDALLKLENKKGKMSYSIVSTGDKAFETSTDIPLLDVVGDKNYHYSYKSDDGKIQIVIDSPDYINIKVSDRSDNGGYIIQSTFVGKKI